MLWLLISGVCSAQRQQGPLALKRYKACLKVINRRVLKIENVIKFGEECRRTCVSLVGLDLGLDSGFHSQDWSVTCVMLRFFLIFFNQSLALFSNSAASGKK